VAFVLKFKQSFANIIKCYKMMRNAGECVQENIQRREETTKPRKHTGEERREYLFQPATRCPPAMDSFCRLCLLKKTQESSFSSSPFLVIVVPSSFFEPSARENLFLPARRGCFYLRDRPTT